VYAHSITSAQTNLVPNPSFDDHTICPEDLLNSTVVRNNLFLTVHQIISTIEIHCITVVFHLML
jgi:hypothetical protein